jgi:outer membrane protein
MKTLCLAAAAALAVVSPVAAQQAGDLTIGLGIAHVNPKGDNGTPAGGTVPVSIGENARPEITAEYFLRDNVGVELLAALPFKHSIKTNGTRSALSSTCLRSCRCSITSTPPRS